MWSRDLCPHNLHLHPHSPEPMLRATSHTMRDPRGGSLTKLDFWPQSCVVRVWSENACEGTKNSSVGVSRTPWIFRNLRSAFFRICPTQIGWACSEKSSHICRMWNHGHNPGERPKIHSVFGSSLARTVCPGVLGFSRPHPATM